MASSSAQGRLLFLEKRKQHQDAYAGEIPTGNSCVLAGEAEEGDCAGVMAVTPLWSPPLVQ